MRITQGTFSFLPDLTDAQIATQIRYCMERDWAVNIEFTDDPHPRNTYWEMWGPPMFDLADPEVAMKAVRTCREAHPDNYIRVSGFDASHGWETVRLSFIVHRPAVETRYRLDREEAAGRNQRYATRERRA